MKSLVIILCIAATALVSGEHLGPIPSLREEKIIGGAIAGLDELPYQVSLQVSGVPGTHFCGGSVLSATSVLTSAECLLGLGADLVEAVAGEWSISVNSGSEQRVQAASLIPHKSYIYGTGENDIAIIKLKDSFNLGSSVRAITLPPRGYEVNEGTTCTVSGWGAVNYGGPPTDILRKAYVNIVSEPKCDLIYEGTTNLITISKVCASAEGSNYCDGDSGGPLYCNGMQVGVVSNGEGCAESRYPGIYTKVSYFIYWINANA